MSARNPSISATVGGRPVRSKATRRTSVVRSASGPGASPFASRAARMKRSTSVRAGPRTSGTVGAATGRNARWAADAGGSSARAAAQTETTARPPRNAEIRGVVSMPDTLPRRRTSAKPLPGSFPVRGPISFPERPGIGYDRPPDPTPVPDGRNHVLAVARVAAHERPLAHRAPADGLRLPRALQPGEHFGRGERPLHRPGPAVRGADGARLLGVPARLHARHAPRRLPDRPRRAAVG